MAILRIGAFGSSYLLPASFENERELEGVLAENPQLLVASGGAPPLVLATHLTLPDACRLDLLLIDEESVPVVVHTSLVKSGDRRREVVAQAVDSISAMTRMPVEQLDELCGGSVERALRLYAADDRDFARRWASLGVNLRAARVRFIVAVDELMPALDRAIRFLADHSSLAIQCVTIAKSRERNGDTCYAPAIVLGADHRSSPLPSSSKAAAPEPAEVFDWFNRTPPTTGLRLVGAAAHDRKIGEDLGRLQWDG